MLRQILATLLLMSSVATAYGIQAESEWVKFTSPKALFSVMLPREPKLDTETGGTTEHQRFNDFEEGYGFVIEYFENVSASDPEKYLDGTIAAVQNAVKGTLVEEKKISLDGYSGREVTISITAANGTVVFSRTKVYLVGNNLFSISYLWKKDLDPAIASKIGERCFSSLKIKPRA